MRAILLPMAFLAAMLTQTANADLLSTFGQLLDPPDQTPHSAVARIYAREAGTLASGTGTLVHADELFGYVLTNWHVVREAEQGQVVAVFPDRFESAASVLKTDEQWDLALLKIWRPNSSPMPLSTIIPAVGEPLTIIGYGSGKYRAANGRCQYYAAPDSQSPQEMIEVSVAARQGDSGGPIVNRRGELAAVLFGSGQGITTGTHVGRVVRFLNSVAIPASPDATEQVAADRVIKPEKTQQAAFVTPPKTAGAGKPSQYYKLPPLEWSTVDDETTVVTAAARSTAAQPRAADQSLAAVVAKQQTESSVAVPGSSGLSPTQVATPTRQTRATSELTAGPQFRNSLRPSGHVRVTRQVTPLLRSRSSTAHDTTWMATRKDRWGSEYSTASFGDSYGSGGNNFEDVEVAQSPKSNLRRFLAIIQTVLALVGIFALVDKFRN